MGPPGTVPSDAPQLAQSLREGVAALPFFFFALLCFWLWVAGVLPRCGPPLFRHFLLLLRRHRTQQPWWVRAPPQSGPSLTLSLLNLLQHEKNNCRISFPFRAAVVAIVSQPDRSVRQPADLTQTLALRRSTMAAAHRGWRASSLRRSSLSLSSSTASAPSPHSDTLTGVSVAELERLQLAHDMVF